MTPEHWQRVSPYLYDALDLATEQRGPWLVELESSQPEIATEVRRLLEAGDNKQSFLEHPAWEPKPAPAGPVRWSIETGTLLSGRFQVAEGIGRGGFGEVYRAFDRWLRKWVAMKVLKPQFAADPEALDRFRKELNAAIQIKHDNVCRLFDIFLPEKPGAAPVFFTMELLEGETLSARLKRGRLDPTEAGDIVRQLINGLAAAHDKEIIHRDLKPGNIILSTGGASARLGVRPVILDFGLAREVRPAGETQETATAFAGTPPYAAPEQLMGQRATPRSDIHALGMVMYEMMTGELPFKGDSALAIAAARLHEDAPSPRKLVKDIDRRWEAAISACIEREAAKRPASVFDILSILEVGGPDRRSRALTRRWMLAAAGAAPTAAIAEYLLTRRGSSEPRNAEARRHWQQGIETARRVNAKDYQTAIDEFQQALAIEPSSATVWADLAGTYAKAYNFEFFPNGNLLVKARDAARAAIKRDGKLAVAHGVLGFVQSLDLKVWPTAGAEFDLALAIGGVEPQVHSWHALYLMKTGRFKKALGECGTAVRQDSVDFYSALARATVCFAARDLKQLDDATAWLVRYHNDKPNSHLMRARWLEWSGDPAQATSEVAESERLNVKSSTAMLARASIDLTKGRTEEALRVANNAEAQWASEGVEVMLLAGIYARAGDNTRAFSILDRAWAEGKSTVLSVAVNPHLDGIRNDPRYPPFLKKVGFNERILCGMDAEAQKLQGQIMQQMGLSSSSCKGSLSQPI